MGSKITINLLVLFCLLFTGTDSKVNSEPREKLIEEALLQQLHPVIMSSLRDIYKEEYSQLECERIISINEQTTIKNKDHTARPADAIHGAEYFEITILICRPNEESVKLILKNDTATAQYYLLDYEIVPPDKNE